MSHGDFFFLRGVLEMAMRWVLGGDGERAGLLDSYWIFGHLAVRIP